MAKGEFDSPSKAASEAYRLNHERLWPKLDPAFEPEVCYRSQADGHYPNGCPILEAE